MASPVGFTVSVKESTMKNLAFIFGLCILAVGLMGVIAPASLVWLAQRFASPAPFYVLAAVRLAFGLVLISVAPKSRVPRALRAVGYIVVFLGVITMIAGFAAVEPARAAIDSWTHQRAAILRVTALIIVALGGFLAYACAPNGRRVTADG